MTDRSLYTSQSAISDPGTMKGWLAGLPADFTTLRALARPLVAHYRADDLAAVPSRQFQTLAGGDDREPQCARVRTDLELLPG